MSENKCCGNCANSYGKDMDGYCACGIDDHFTGCDEFCDKHIMRINGWTEITPDNVDEVRKTDVGRLMIAVTTHGEPYYMEFREMFRGLDEMARKGGYYYYVVPELKIE